VQDAGISDAAIALSYQLGSLILPALAPIFVWVLMNRRLVEQFVGWRADQMMSGGKPGGKAGGTEKP
jgi:hypothetical protein